MPKIIALASKASGEVYYLLYDGRTVDEPPTDFASQDEMVELVGSLEISLSLFEKLNSLPDFSSFPAALKASRDNLSQPVMRRIEELRRSAAGKLQGKKQPIEILLTIGEREGK